jgi:hypothetical protein
MCKRFRNCASGVPPSTRTRRAESRGRTLPCSAAQRYWLRLPRTRSSTSRTLW